MENVIEDLNLRSNIKHAADRIKAGFFNIFIVWGPTRTGKSTLVFKCAKDLCMYLGQDFSVEENIWFSSKEILEAGKKGVKRAVYVLDEASFDGKGIDWQNKDQQNLIKLFNTAAKYNQTYFLILPNLEELKKTFIRDAHSMGIQVGYNQRTLQRGFFRLYTKQQFLNKYWLLVNGRVSEAQRAQYAYQGKFSDDVSFMNDQAYQAKKDEAIKRLGEEVKKEKENKLDMVYRKKLANVLKMLQAVGKTPKELSSMANIDIRTFNRLINDDKNTEGQQPSATLD